MQIYRELIFENKLVFNYSKMAKQYRFLRQRRFRYRSLQYLTVNYDILEKILTPISICQLITARRKHYIIVLIIVETVFGGTRSAKIPTTLFTCWPPCQAVILRKRLTNSWPSVLENLTYTFNFQKRKSKFVIQRGLCMNESIKNQAPSCGESKLFFALNKG